LINTRQLSVDGLLCALVIAPRVYARNRFFDLFEQPVIRRVRRRASLLRGVVRQLTNSRGPRGETIGEQVLADGRVLLRYVVPGLNFTRTTALTGLEAAIVRYLVARSRNVPCKSEDFERIEQALAGLAGGLPRPVLERSPEPIDPK
jgi:hypothetical protein